MRHSLQQIARYFILFMAVSFLGWGAETLFFLLCYGRFYDRGFLTLPFCTIYGCSFLLLYGLIGTPADTESGLLRSFKKTTRHPLLIYALISAFVVTLLELITGWAFDQVFRLRLWNYSAYYFHFHGYICLEYALLWGFLLPPCMRYAWIPLKNFVFSLPLPYLHSVSVSLAFLTLLDWSLNLYRQSSTFL